MPIRIPDGLPARDHLIKEGVRVMSERVAIRQDIRPMRIGLLNLMPNKIRTELQMARLIGASPLQVELTLARVGGHRVRAARALGMPLRLMLRRVIVPRAFRLALPAYGNEIILMLKGSALASTITLLDITGVARVIVARTFAPYELFLLAAIFYLTLTLVIVRTLKYAEWRLSPHLRPPPHSG